MKDKAMSTYRFRGESVLPISSTRCLRWLESFEMMARNIIISLSNFRYHRSHPERSVYITQDKTNIEGRLKL